MGGNAVPAGKVGFLVRLGCSCRTRSPFSCQLSRGGHSHARAPSLHLHSSQQWVGGWVQSSHTRNPFSFLSWTQSGVGLPRRGHVVTSAQCPGSSGVWFETQALGPPRLRLQPPRGTASLGKDPRPGDRKLRLAEPLAAGETRHCCSRLPKMLAFCLSWIFRTNSYFLKYV